ncbi:MAG: T9SS type A sorting domain-containing protein [Flavipsychrobacter sp.]|nr:T9SS type A sorting domain-containing protein [Flavipsychrobacter sp.]
MAHFLVLFSVVTAHAQTTLTYGDVLCTGYNSVTTGTVKYYQFVLAKAAAPGTFFKMSNTSFYSSANANSASNAFIVSTGITKWENTTGSTLPIGTVITFTFTPSISVSCDVGAATNLTTTCGCGPFNNGGYNNNTSGSKMLIYSASSSTESTSTNFSSGTSPATFNGSPIFMIGFQGLTSGYTNWLSSGSPTNNMSYLPGDLASYNLFFAGKNGGVYSGSRTFSSVAAMQAAILNTANWSTTSSPSSSPMVVTGSAGNFTIATAPSLSLTGQTNIACFGGATGSATVTATGGTTPYTYSWAPSGGSAAVASGLSAGTYTCTVTDAASGTATVSVTITQPSAISTGTSSVTNVACNGGSNGAATISASGGAGSFTYSWAPSGGTAASISGRSAGSYTCTVTDANSCTKTQVVTITQPAAIATSVSSQTNVACNGGSTGAATISASGGTGGFTYSWAPSGGSAATASGLTAGSYTCTVTDANGCTKTQVVTITQPAAISTSVSSQTNVACNGGTTGAATISASGGTGSLSYAWAPSGGSAASASGLSAGSYTCTVTDANGCTKTQVVTITQPAAISTSISSQTNVACNGGSTGAATISSGGGAGSFTYSWAPSGGSAASVSGRSAGSYTCTVTDANGCTKTQVVTITQPTAITTSVSSVTNVTCNGGTNGAATISASGGASGYSYSWAPSGGTAASISGRSAGVYTCTVTDANSCTKTQSVTITQPAVVTISLGTSPTVSSGTTSASLPFTATTGSPTQYSITFSGAAITAGFSNVSGATLPASPITVTVPAGAPVAVYSATLTPSNASCTGTPVAFSVEVATAALSATTLQTNVSCNGGANGTATVSVSGGQSPYSYSWSPSGGSAASATGLSAGTYTCTITDALSSVLTKTVSITQPSAPVGGSTVVTNVSCSSGSNGAINLTPSGGVAPYTFAWGGGVTTEDRTGLVAGSYSCVVTDDNGCTATVSATVTQPSSAVGGSTTVANVACNAGTNGAINLTPSGGTSPYTFNWGGGIVTEDRTGLAAGSYSCVVTDNNGCTATVSATVTQPTALGGSTSVTNVSCFSGSTGAIDLTPSGGTPGYTYNWGSGITTQDRTGLVAGSYSCVVTDANSCTATVSATVTQPSAAVGGTATVTNVSCAGGSNGAIDLTPSGGTPGYTYNWGSGITTQDRTGLSAGSYSCIVTDAASCTGTVTATVTQPTGISATITGTNITCFGLTNGTASVSASGGTGALSYSWTPSGGSLASATGLSAGTYTCTVSDASSCNLNKVITITAPSQLTLSSISNSGPVCTGTTLSLSSTVSGGTAPYVFSWSGPSSYTSTLQNPSISSVTASSAGVYTMTPTDANGCSFTGANTTSVIVNNSPVAVMALSPNPTLVGLPVNYSSSSTGVSGYSWAFGDGGTSTLSSSSRSYAAAGTYTAILTVVDTNGCTDTASSVIAVNSTMGPITGNPSFCIGDAPIALTHPISGGTWSSSNPATASIGSATGLVTGVSPGTCIITYNLGGGYTQTKIAFVYPLPLPITGLAYTCEGFTSGLTNTSAGSGTWSSSNTSVATIGTGSGVVSGNSVGTTTITYTAYSGCFTTRTHTVHASPSVPTGSTFICAGDTATFSSSPSGGAWSSSNSGVATIGSSSGLLSGVAGGTSTISYTLPTGCGRGVTITAGQLPAPITGVVSLCPGGVATVASTTSGGTWSSGTTSVATIGSSGVVTAIAPGTSVITYTLASGCKRTAVITVNAAPSASSGIFELCVGGSSVLSNASSGGTWSSSSSSVATVGSATGLVSGIGAGTVNITYRVAGPGCFSVTEVTVNAAPAAISGTTNTCVGTTSSLSHPSSGGTWVSSNTAIAAIDGSTGVVTGIASGIAVITYNVSATCFKTTSFTVKALPSAISGSLSICQGSSTTFSSSPAGGVWDSQYDSVSLINSISGSAYGVSIGNATITYTTTNGCYRTAEVTVNPLPSAISGSAAVCVGSTVSLTNATMGGSWLSGNAARATVDTFSGVVTGVSAGTTTISYVLGTGCRSLAVVTVGTMPSAISGTLTVCEGNSTTLSSVTAGGTWSSAATSVATTGSSVSNSTIVNGLTSGTTDISYTVTGCTQVATVTVNSGPGAISGSSALCIGSSNTLSVSAGGGTWSSGSPAIAYIGSATGIVTGGTAGNAVITYRTSPTCFSTYNVTVNSTPAAISGSLGVCIGFTTTLSHPVAGGSWSSSNTAVASIDGSTGVVTGVAPGSAIVTYVISSGCYKTATVTVYGLPPAIGGSTVFCQSSATTLTNTLGGGTWSSSNTFVATVGTSSGVVSGVSGGTAVITYRLSSSGCYNTREVTVNALPSVISGLSSICVGAPDTLTNDVSGGTWSSSAPSVAAIGSATGYASGVNAGIANISYTLSTGCRRTFAITVNALPAPIAGTFVTCFGSNISLSSTTAGQTWSSSNTSVATVGSTSSTAALVTPVSTGTAVISYTNGAGCFRTTVVTINAALPANTGDSIVCVGQSISMTNSVSGGTWTSSAATKATVGISTGVVNGVAAGTTNITYSKGGGCFAVSRVTVNAAVATITGTMSVCMGQTVTLYNTTSGGTWISGTTSKATIDGSTGVATGVSAGVASITYSLGSGCYKTTSLTVKATPAAISGPATVAVGSSVTLSSTSPTGTWSSSASSVATVGSSTGIVSGVNSGSATITYRVPSTGCYTTLEMSVTAPRPGTVDELPTDLVFNVYPNPANELLNVNTSVSGIFYLMSLDGKVVANQFMQSGVNTFIVDPNLASGIYMCSFRANDGSQQTSRLVLER